MQSKLLARTLDLARASDEPLKSIAENSGIPYNWLYCFINYQRAKSPNVIYVEALYVYLSGKPLDLS